MRRIRLTVEGWRFLLVTAILFAGAMLRGVNLLIILAGMMVGALLVNAWWAWRSLAKLEVERRLPPAASAGDVISVKVAVRGSGRWSSSWAVVVEDAITRSAAPRAQPAARPQAVVAHVPASGVGRAKYQCLLPRRGRHHFGPLRLSCSFPFGLAQAVVVKPAPASLLATPRIGRGLSNWRRSIATPTSGLQALMSRSAGEEGEFYGLRDWRSGDSTRHIHWRTTAKMNRLMVRQFEQRHAAQLALLVELWQSHAPSDGELERVELAVSLAATILAESCRQGIGRIVVVVTGRRLDVLRGAASTAFLRSTLAWLAEVQAGPEELLHEARARVRRDAPSATVIVSTRSREHGPHSIRRELDERLRAHGRRPGRAHAEETWIEADPDSLASFLR